MTRKNQLQNDLAQTGVCRRHASLCSKRYGTRVIAFFLAAWASAYAQPIEDAYTARRWGVEDGLPERIVTSITQFPDGFVWLTTPRHVVRFDGVEFVAIPQHDLPANKPKRLNGIIRDRQGNVWVSGEDGVMRFDGHVWEVMRLQGELVLPAEKAWTVETPDGLIEQQALLEFFGVWESPDGQVWTATNAGLFRFGGRAFQWVPSGDVAEVGRFIAAEMDDRGRFWLSGKEGLVSFDGQTYTQHAFPSEEDKGRFFRVFPGIGDTLWGKRLDGKLFRRDNGNWTETPPSGMRLAALLEQPDEVWFGTVEGLYRLARNRCSHLLDIDIERAQDVRCLKRTADGSLWVGSGNGLFQLRPRSIHMFPVRAIGQAQTVTALLPRNDHALWVGLANRGLWTGSAGSLRPLVADPPVLNGANISSLLLTRDGSLWVGTRGDHLWRVSTNGIVKQVRSREGYASRHITCLIEDRSERLWVGTWEGLLVVDPAGWLVTADGPDDAVLSLCEGEGGKLWVGTQNSGLWALTLDGKQIVRQEVGLPSDTIRALHRDTEGILWIATSQGLARLEDRRPRPENPEAGPLMFCFTREHGIPDDDIRQMLDDGQGVLWVGTRHNLLQIKKTDLADVATGRMNVLPLRAFSKGDGLAAQLSGGDYSGPLAVRTDDGRLWFATHSGIAMLDPCRLDAASVAPPVYVEGFSAGGSKGAPRHYWAQRAFARGSRSREPRDSGISTNDRIVPRANEFQQALPVTLRADCRDIDFRFTAPCYAAPEQVLFRTRLDGFDSEWSSPSTERYKVYSRLPPGAFTFRVMAAFSAGGWHEAEQSIQLIVKPFVWQTAWFQVAAALLALGVTGFLTGVLFRNRARRKLLVAEKIRAHELALEHERARIARDVHDEVGAGLTEIAMLSDWVLRDIAATAERGTQDRMSRVCQAAVGLVRSVDGIVWAVNPANDTVERFVSYLTHYAERFLGATGQHFRVTATSPLPSIEITGAVRHSIFQAVREALNNAVKHARATKIGCEVFVEEGWLRIVVSDDGCGFDIASISRDGTCEGLGNMRRRMQQAGGTIDVDSRLGGGTRVVFSVKLHAAGE